MILHDATITPCELRNVSGSGFYKGGGTTVHGDLFLSNSTISNNILSTDFGHALGGGVYSFRSMQLRRSTVTGNTAEGVGASSSAHGGCVSSLRRRHRTVRNHCSE